MPGIVSAVWRVTFMRESLTDQARYWQEFAITYGRQPVEDFAKEIEKAGYVNVEISFRPVLV